MLSAADGGTLWSRTLYTETFGVTLAPDSGALRVNGYDNCPDEYFTRDYDRETGKVIGEPPRGPSDGVGEPTVYDPPSPCLTSPRRRVSLAPGRQVDVCNDTILTVRDVQSGAVLFTSEQISSFEAYDVGVLGRTSDAFVLHAFDGAQRWTWQPPGPYTYALGADSERIYLWEEGGDLFALGVTSGAVVWQAERACDLASYLDGQLVCGRFVRKSECESD